MPGATAFQGVQTKLTILGPISMSSPSATSTFLPFPAFLSPHSGCAKKWLGGLKNAVSFPSDVWSAKAFWYILRQGTVYGSNHFASSCGNQTVQLMFLDQNGYVPGPIDTAGSRVCITQVWGKT